MPAGLSFTVAGPMLREAKALQKKHDAWLKDLRERGLTPEEALAAYADRSVANLSSLVMLAREGLSFAALKRMEDEEEASAEDVLEDLADEDEEAFEDEDADRYVTPLRSRR